MLLQLLGVLAVVFLKNVPDVEIIAFGVLVGAVGVVGRIGLEFYIFVVGLLVFNLFSNRIVEVNDVVFMFRVD